MLKKQYAALGILCLIASSLAHGAEQKDFAGSWVMRLGERNLFVLTLAADGNAVRGIIERPAKLSSLNNALFSNLTGGLTRENVLHSQLAGNVLHLALPDWDDPKQEDQYVMTIIGNRAELAPAGPTDGAPFPLQRAPARAKPATDWEPNRTYAANDGNTSNAEMKAIYDEDQRVRLAKQIDWDAVNRTDAERREQTRKLLAAGALHTGQDYENASFIFQHGHTADDYLLAHTLAMVAVSKGDAGAIWIAAATLDRYLENIGQKQILGTQFTTNPDHHVTQEPYARDVVSDALRAQLGVPSAAQQAEMVKLLQAQQGPAGK